MTDVFFQDGANFVRVNVKKAWFGTEDRITFQDVSQELVRKKLAGGKAVVFDLSKDIFKGYETHQRFLIGDYSYPIFRQNGQEAVIQAQGWYERADHILQNARRVLGMKL
jgi:hypothetical protein